MIGNLLLKKLSGTITYLCMIKMQRSNYNTNLQKENNAIILFLTKKKKEKKETQENYLER